MFWDFKEWLVNSKNSGEKELKVEDFGHIFWMEGISDVKFQMIKESVERFTEFTEGPFIFRTFRLELLFFDSTLSENLLNWDFGRFSKNLITWFCNGFLTLSRSLFNLDPKLLQIAKN
jgi:hypothetical protein